MLEKLGFQALVEQTLKVKRNQCHEPVSIHPGDGASLYVGFSRLNQLRFFAREPILTGILGVRQATAAMHVLAILMRFI